jgi:ribosomal 30S subunit maturation factor RimM
VNTDDAADQEWVTIAVLGRVRGNRGELTAISLSKPERYEALREVFLFPEGTRREVESVWFHAQRLILKFRGVDTISDAERLEQRATAARARRVLRVRPDRVRGIGARQHRAAGSRDPVAGDGRVRPAGS